MYSICFERSLTLFAATQLQARTGNYRRRGTRGRGREYKHELHLMGHTKVTCTQVQILKMSMNLQMFVFFCYVLIYYDVNLCSVLLLDLSPLLQCPFSTIQAIPRGLLCVNGSWSCCSSASLAFLQPSSDTSTATTSLYRNELLRMPAALPR